MADPAGKGTPQIFHRLRIAARSQQIPYQNRGDRA
jgi:hypothetical protein